MEVFKIPAGGFCEGVRLAIARAKEALKEKGAAYACSPLVHNEDVNARLAEEGLRAFDSSDFASNDKSLPVVLSAHGHPASLEAKLKENGFRTVDATCPFVRANEEAIARASKERDVIYLGQVGHEEAKAALSFGNGRAFLIDPSRPFEVPSGLHAPYVYCQTTLVGEDIEKAFKAIKEAYPEASLRRGPCRATEERQRAVASLDGSYDLVVVVGSSTSANARALLKLAREKGAASYLVRSAQELPLGEIKGRKKAAVIGAASTDEVEIDGVVEFLSSIG